MEAKAPNPGSDEAIRQGCQCPILDNSHGRGYLGQPGLYVYSGDCELYRPDFDELSEKNE